MTKIEDKFEFWCPIEKSQDCLDPTTGEKIMRLGGIASTSDKDSDGEYLDPKGFDIKPLKENGLVNWHHQAKGQPSTIIGEPTTAEIRPEGLYIETDLYPSSKIACDVWELAQTLEKDSKTRRLGYSIEGRVIKRKSNDKKSPDYKQISKAIITGVAITHQPKNPKTFANIIKGETDDIDDEEEENTKEEDKGLNTENASALKKESVDSKVKKQNFSKAEIVEKLFKDIPAISIDKAEKIHLMLIKIANMEGRKNVTSDDIQKAYEALGLDAVEGDDVTKGCGGDGMQSEKPTKKAKTSTKKKEADEEETAEEEANEDEEDEEAENKGGKKVQKGADGGNRFDRIEKAIATSHQINSKYIKALGVMMKDATQKLEAAAERESELLDVVKAQDETISSMSERVEAFGAEVPAPKSLSSSRPVERQFSKGNDNDFGGKEKTNEKQISMSRQGAAVAELLDQATFAKGYDDEFSKAVTHFEATKSLPANIIARIKNDYGFEIVK